MRQTRTLHPWLFWPSVLGAAFLLARALTTLLMGASFAAPGDGWRSLWQLLIAAVLLAGAVRPEWARATVGFVGAVYAVSTGLELVDPTELLGVIPVDMRDRVVHPTIAIVAFGCLARDGAVARRAIAA